jgi:uncharacterized protein YdeI (YjbR/CyaY-like superfamily)
MNTDAALFFTDGCGRCPLGGTPACKVHTWQRELTMLRTIILDCGLVEECKWGVPCYTFNRNNVLVLSALKECATIGFFKGALLQDADGVLTKPGENSQVVRMFRFTQVQEIVKMERIIKSYIYEAIELEKAGLKVTFKKNPEPVPDELQNKFDEDPSLETAFFALTPGRQRGYILYFSAPKQAKTRESRIEKCTPMIFSGKGLHDY